MPGHILALTILAMSSLPPLLTSPPMNQQRELQCTVTIVNTRNKHMKLSVLRYMTTNCFYVKTIEFQKGDKFTRVLQELMSIKNISRCGIISFLPVEQYRLIQEVLSNTHQLMTNYTNTQFYGSSLLKKLIGAKPVEQKYSNSDLQIKGFALLTEHLTSKKIFIITEGFKDDVEFVEKLTKEIHAQRLKNHATDYEIEMYALVKNNQHTPIIDILTNIQSEEVSRRTFLLLTSPEITSLFFEASDVLGMNLFSDLWIVRHAVYNLQNTPSQTITYSNPEYKELQPRYKINSSQFVDSINVENGYRQICSISIDNSSQQKLIEQYTGFNETTPTMYIKLWWQSSWLTIFLIKNNHGTINLLSYVSEYSFLSALGINHYHILKIVTVVEGPFLLTADYLYNSNQTVCESNAILCKQAHKSNNTTIWENTCCYGYSVDLIKELIHLLGFQIDLYIVEDGKYGAFDTNTGKLNGMVGDVYYEKADMAVAGLTINTDRLKYVDFTVPFIRAEIGIVTLKRRIAPNYINSDFLTNLGPYMPYAVMGIFLAAFIAIFITDNIVLFYLRKYNQEFRHRYNIKLYDWQDCFTYASGLLFQRELGGKNPSTSGGRTTALFFAFAMVTMTTLYTASLTALRVVDTGEQEFFGLKDERMQKPTAAFKFATSSHTSIEAFFKNAPDENLNRMYHFMKPYNVNNLKEGINKVLNDELQAYLNEYPFLTYYIAKESQCTLEIHENPIGQSTYGIAIAKHSHLQNPISEALLQLQEDGSLLQLQQKWLTTNCNQDNQFNTNEQFSLYFFATPLLLLGLIMIICGIILGAEIYIHKFLIRKQRGTTITGDLTSYWKQVKSDKFSIIVRQYHSEVEI